MKFVGMIVMMIVFLALLFLVNYSVFYVFIKSKKVVSWISLSSMFLILLGMVLSNIFENSILGSLRQSINFYLGTIFIFFIVSLFFNTLNLFLKTESKYLGVSLLVIGLFLVGFSVINSLNFENNNYIIESDKLDKDYKIVHISDIHIGSNPGKSLRTIVDYINSLNSVDAVFLTGDLVDENIKYEDISTLNDLKYKTYFIYGNHEFYVKGDNLKEILTKTNMSILRNKSIEQEGLQIIGFDDSADLERGFQNIPANQDKFTILMYHQPSQIKIAKNNQVDLMLSGHTHAGQIWPFNYLVRLQFKYIEGLHQIDDMWLNVNSGTGTWGPKMRLGSKNEISVIELRKK